MSVEAWTFVMVASSFALYIGVAFVGACTDYR